MNSATFGVHVLQSHGGSLVRTGQLAFCCTANSIADHVISITPRLETHIWGLRYCNCECWRVARHKAPRRTRMPPAGSQAATCIRVDFTQGPAGLTRAAFVEASEMSGFSQQNDVAVVDLGTSIEAKRMMRRITVPGQVAGAEFDPSGRLSFPRFQRHRPGRRLAHKYLWVRRIRLGRVAVHLYRLHAPVCRGLRLLTPCT